MSSGIDGFFLLAEAAAGAVVLAVTTVRLLRYHREAGRKVPLVVRRTAESVGFVLDPSSGKVIRGSRAGLLLSFGPVDPTRLVPGDLYNANEILRIELSSVLPHEICIAPPLAFTYSMKAYVRRFGDGSPTRTGDDAFDNQLQIFAPPNTPVTGIVNRDARKTLLELLRIASFQIRDGALTCASRISLTDPADATHLLNTATAALQAVYRPYEGPDLEPGQVAVAGESEADGAVSVARVPEKN